MKTCPSCNGDSSAYSWWEPPCMVCGGSLTVSQATLDDYNRKLDAATAKVEPGKWFRAGVNSYYKPKAPAQG